MSLRDKTKNMLVIKVQVTKENLTLKDRNTGSEYKNGLMDQLITASL